MMEKTEKKKIETNGRCLDFLAVICITGWIFIPLPEHYVIAFTGACLQFYSYFLIKLFSFRHVNENMEREPDWFKFLQKMNKVFVHISQKYLWRIVKLIPIPLIIASCWLLPKKQRYISWLIIAYFYTCVGGAVIFYEKEVKNEKGGKNGKNRKGIHKSNKMGASKLCQQANKFSFFYELD